MMIGLIFDSEKHKTVRIHFPTDFSSEIGLAYQIRTFVYTVLFHKHVSYGITGGILYGAGLVANV